MGQRYQEFLGTGKVPRNQKFLMPASEENLDKTTKVPQVPKVPRYPPKVPRCSWGPNVLTLYVHRFRLMYSPLETSRPHPRKLDHFDG